MNTNRSLYMQLSVAAMSCTMLAAAFAHEQTPPASTNIEASTPTAVGIPTPPPVSAAAVPAPAKLTQAQLDQMLAPIALYPDPLLAATLAAAAHPAEIAAAVRWRTANPAANEQDIDAQPWQPAVKTLIRYPATLNLLNQYMEWTAALGKAYVTQQADVVAAIQRKRAQAIAQKNLFTTPQQKVATVDNAIAITPADPNIMYVPIYDPSTIYVQSYSYIDSGIRFGYGAYLGDWYSYNIDWRRRCVTHGPGWGHHGPHHGHGPGGPPHHPTPPTPAPNTGWNPTIRPVFGNYGPANLSQLPGGRLPYSNFGIGSSSLPRMEWSSRQNRFGSEVSFGSSQRPTGHLNSTYGAFGRNTDEYRRPVTQWRNPSYPQRTEFRGSSVGAAGPSVSAPSYGTRSGGMAPFAAGMNPGRGGR